MSRLLLISNSTVHGRDYLDHVEPEIRDFAGNRVRVVFIPYGLHDRRAYCAQTEGRFRKMGLEFTSAHDVSNALRAIEHSEIIFIGGGLMGHSKIVCDVIDQCAAMGDLHHALDAGTMRVESVHAELGEIVAGRKPGRESAEEVIVFDSTGMALQDVATSATVYEKALREKVGTSLKLAA